MELLLSGGPVLVAILLVSLYALYIFFERLLKLSREPVSADVLMTQVNAAIKERNLERALVACEQFGGPVARVIRAAFDGFAPLLLLDEIAAHLDESRRNGLFDELINLGAQAWMTGTDLSLFSALGERAQYLAMDDGSVKRN